MKEKCERQNGMKLSLLTRHPSVCNTTMVGFESGDTMERGCRTVALRTATLVLHRVLCCPSLPSHHCDVLSAPNSNSKRALYSDEDLQMMKEKERKLDAELQSTLGSLYYREQVLGLEEEEAPPGKSSSPLTVKPIMLKIVESYNLIVQDVNRKFPGTVNKMAGNYIKIQPATPDDHRDIVTHLENIRAQHYIIKRLADRPIKVVLKGLPVKTDAADIEDDLKSQGFEVEKVAQLRKFSTKEPLPIFMVEVRRNEKAELIYDLKTVCYLSVTVDPFRKKPGATQCYNCNYFNHSSIICRMTLRCLKCGKDHCTGDCSIKEKLENRVALIVTRRDM
ncbi:nucleic-acid-binding protein from transposon X-element [Trichonephila clavipes]|nr:nucleic-acid-binding protein from transposon X-element [Trichonephila clavipes]